MVTNLQQKQRQDAESGDRHLESPENFYTKNIIEVTNGFKDCAV